MSENLFKDYQKTLTTTPKNYQLHKVAPFVEQVVRNIHQFNQINRKTLLHQQALHYLMKYGDTDFSQVMLPQITYRNIILNRLKLVQTLSQVVPNEEKFELAHNLQKPNFINLTITNSNYLINLTESNCVTLSDEKKFTITAQPGTNEAKNNNYYIFQLSENDLRAYFPNEVQIDNFDDYNNINRLEGSYNYFDLQKVGLRPLYDF